MSTFSPIYMTSDTRLAWVFLMLKGNQTELFVEGESVSKGYIALTIDGKYATKKFSLDDYITEITLNENELTFSEDYWISGIINNYNIYIIMNIVSHILGLVIIMLIIYRFFAHLKKSIREN